MTTQTLSISTPKLVGAQFTRRPTGLFVAVATAVLVVIASRLVSEVLLIATGAILIACALIDEATNRIPNRLTLTLALVSAASWPAIAIEGHRTLLGVATAVLSGVLLSGAPVLFVIWLVRPRLVGGGDWKLLGAVGLACGVINPLLAAVTTLVACVVQFGRFAVEHKPSIAFAPAIAAGFLGALCLVPSLERYGGLAP